MLRDEHRVHLGQGGLFRVLTADEKLESDVAAAREDRRGAEGFISPADARAFLELARRGEGGDARDPITRAYFRALNVPAAEAEAAPTIASPSAALAALGAQEGLVHVAARLFEQAMSDLRERDPARFAARVREVAYLMNVWIAGGTHEGRRPRPMEALEMVLQTCEAGMRTLFAASPEDALEVLSRTPADVLFRRGFRSH